MAGEREEQLIRAAAPFASGGAWGKWKAWRVEGAELCGNAREDGLSSAAQITRWQATLDAALASRPAPEPVSDPEAAELRELFPTSTSPPSAPGGGDA